MDDMRVLELDYGGELQGFSDSEYKDEWRLR